MDLRLVESEPRDLLRIELSSEFRFDFRRPSRSSSEDFRGEPGGLTTGTVSSGCGTSEGATLETILRSADMGLSLDDVLGDGEGVRDDDEVVKVVVKRVGDGCMREQR